MKLQIANLNKLINHHSKDKSLCNPRLIPLLIYQGKLHLKNDQHQLAFDSFYKAYSTAKKLSSMNYSYHLYSKMYSEFHLGAFLYLYSEKVTGNTINNPTKLLKSSKKCIMELMKPSENIAEKYLEINKEAFHFEEEYIDTFLDYIDNKTKDRAALKRALLHFFVFIS